MSAGSGGCLSQAGAGEDGECRAVHAVGSSSLVWPGLLATQSRLTPLFQMTKLPPTHRATSDPRKEPASALVSRLECLQQAVLKTTTGVPPHRAQHPGPGYQEGEHGLGVPWGKGKSVFRSGPRLPQTPRATSTLLHHGWLLHISLKGPEKTLGADEGCTEVFLHPCAPWSLLHGPHQLLPETSPPAHWLLRESNRAQRSGINTLMPSLLSQIRL